MEMAGAPKTTGVIDRIARTTNSDLTLEMLLSSMDAPLIASVFDA